MLGAKERCVAKYSRGSLDPDVLEAATEAAWKRLAIRKPSEIAKILGISEEDVGKLESAPVGVEPQPKANLETEIFILIGAWVGKEVILGLLADIAKEELRRRLRKVWTDLILPEIRNAKSDHRVVGDEYDHD